MTSRRGDTLHFSRVLRRSNRELLGWFYNNPDTQVLQTPISIRHTVFYIVTLNIRTLKALQDGWHGSPQVISRCYDDYQGFLSETEVELVDWLTEQGGSHFDSRVSEYVTSMSLETAMGYLTDPRTSKFYAQFIDISLKKYQAARAHAALASKANPGDITIPENFNYCRSYQSYIEATTVEEQETRNFLKAALKGAKQLLLSIRMAADDGYLDRAHLELLKQKLVALQENYPDAWAAIYGDTEELFDPTDETWWDTKPRKKIYLKGYEMPATEVSEYNKTKRLIHLWGFFVPATCMLACIPVGFAWVRSNRQSGRVDDPDFSQLIAASIIQLLSLVTLVYPTVFSARLARLPGLLTWILITVSASCTISSVPLYLLSTTAWSMVIAFTGTIAQALILMQIVQGI